jgi:ADP-heptose:LPS heptosyltransferase
MLAPFRPLLPVFGREFRLVTAPVFKQFTSPKYAGMLEYGGTYGGAYLLRRGLFMPWELPELLDPDLVKEGWAELQTLVRLEETLDGLWNSRLKVSALELQWYMRHQLLRDSDWAGMGHSVEIRVPFVDINLLQQIGPTLTAAHPLTKREVAAASSRLVTPEILDRPKTGFQIPVREWLMTDQPAHAVNSPHKIADRGLRGWAMHVYRRFGGVGLRVQRKRSSTPRTVSATTVPNTKPDLHDAKRILVFRIGQLGDTIVSLPAMWAVRDSFPKAHMALLCDRHPGKASLVLATSLLKGAGIFDDYISYPVDETADLLKAGRMGSLLLSIRLQRFDTLAYLAPTGRKPEQVARDYRFFRLAGIRNFIGMSGFKTFDRETSGPLQESPSESELLLARLAESGLTLSPHAAKRMQLGLGEEEDGQVRSWLKTLPPDSGKTWVAIAPGSKMPAKRWPLRRFETVVKHLIEEFDIWPVVFGGEEDRVIGDWLVEHWGRGYNAAGALGIRSSMAAMQRCAFFVGNDTGTMHMAAAMGLRCVAIFSSRERPGMWYPHGDNHQIFRTPIECEGCGLVECLERGNECINRIGIEEVLEATREILRVSHGSNASANASRNLRASVEATVPAS